MFNQHNTEGYTDLELAKLNSELEHKLIGIDDPEKRDEIEKNFNDEVSRRY